MIIPASVLSLALVAIALVSLIGIYVQACRLLAMRLERVGDFIGSVDKELTSRDDIEQMVVLYENAAGSMARNYFFYALAHRAQGRGGDGVNFLPSLSASERLRFGLELMRMMFWSNPVLVIAAWVVLLCKRVIFASYSLGRSLAIAPLAKGLKADFAVGTYGLWADFHPRKGGFEVAKN